MRPLLGRARPPGHVRRSSPVGSGSLQGGVMAGVVLALSLCASSPRDASGQTLHRILPGERVQEAIDRAEEGDTLLLAQGDHRGPVTIDRRVVLRGEAGARLIGNGIGSVVTVEADGVGIEHLEVLRSGRDLSKEDSGILVVGNDVRISHVELRENLHGIYVRYGKRAHLLDNVVVGLAALGEEVAVVGADALLRADAGHDAPPGTQALMGNGIHLFNAVGSRVERNRIEHVRDGIYVAHTGEAVFRGNRIHDSRYGIHYMYSSDNLIAENELWGNVAGPALMFSRNLVVEGNLLRDHAGFRAYGLLLQNVDVSQIRDNEIRGNRVAMRLQQSSSNAFRGNHLFGNLAGMTINGSSRHNLFTRNDFGLNMRQVELIGAAPSNEWSVDGVGNLWQGALPLDLTGDGISEWPHHEVDLMAETREQFPPVELLTGSLGLRALEWALARAPVPGVPHVTDPHPLIRRERRGGAPR